MLRAVGTELMKHAYGTRKFDLQVLQMFCSGGATCKFLNLIALEKPCGNRTGKSRLKVDPEER
jgi:hypothetical protein